MPANLHLLTVLHSTERTGPPLFALRFLSWLHRRQPSWTLTTLSLGGSSELLGEFEQLGRVVVGTPVAPGGTRARHLLANLSNDRLRRRVRQLGRIDVAHVHCAGSMRALEVLPPVPVLCHLHELSVGLELHTSALARKHLATATRYAAVSETVRDSFVDRFPVGASRIAVHPGSYDPETAPPAVEVHESDDDDRSRVVVASGVRHWRKGPELLVRVALELHRGHPDIRWRVIWVGGGDDGRLQRLIRAAGLDDTITVIDHQPDAVPWIAAADVLLLTAREDAFPLVCVEAAALGTPVVCFDSGGASSLVQESGCGTVVPFPDVGALAAAVHDVVVDPQRRARFGAAGRAYASAWLSPDRQGARLLGEIEALTRR